jgi:hypothetical protein
MPPSRLRNPTRPIQTGYVPSSQCQTTALRHEHKAQRPKLAKDETPKTAPSRRPSNFFYSRNNGGAGRDRTDDLKLAKLPLSQLSYGPFLCRSGAARLAQTCAARGRACGDYRRRCQSLSISRPGSAGDAKGVERPTGRRALLREKPRRRTSPPAFEASIKWWAWDDSNVRPHPYQGCALTT